MVMVGESVQEMQLAAWIGTTALAFPIPTWMGVVRDFPEHPRPGSTNSYCSAGGWFILCSRVPAESGDHAGMVKLLPGQQQKCQP